MGVGVILLITVTVVKVGGAGHRRSSFSEFGVQYQYLLCSCYKIVPAAATK